MTKIKERENSKSNREKQQITYKGTPIRLSADFSAEILQTRRKWHNSDEKEKTYNKEYSTHWGSHSDLKDKSKVLQTKVKVKRIQHHQTSFTTNAKGISVGEKEKATTRTKKITNGKVHWSRQT